MSQRFFPDNRYVGAVCKRGHWWSKVLDHPDDPTVPMFCPKCGAPVVTACDNCEAALLGGRRGVAARSSPDPFCFNCGAPLPWATREQRIGQLYNLIDFEEGLDQAAHLELVEAIAVLSKSEDDQDVSEDDRVRAGYKVKQLAPEAWRTGLPILQTVISAAVKKKLGLE